MQPHILILDDCRDNALMLSVLLQQSGFEVHTITQPELLRSAMGQFKPQAVLLDLAMPSMNGLDAAKLLRSEGFDGRLIAVTGNGDDVHRRLALEAGFDAFLVKPVDFASLLRNLSSLQPTLR